MVAYLISPPRLEDYLRYAELLTPFNTFHNEALLLKRHFRGRKVWMVSATEQGGGVAEMMPRMMSLLRQWHVCTGAEQ